MGDICCRLKQDRNHCRDMQSDYYIQHHNLAALCFAVATANRIFDSEIYSLNRSVALSTAAGVRSIYDVIKSDSMVTLGEYEPAFSQLRHSIILDDSDDDRSDIN